MDLDRSALVNDLIAPLDPSVAIDDDFLAVNAQNSYPPTTPGSAYDTVDTSAATTLLESAGMSKDLSGTWTVRGAPVVLNFRWASEDPWSRLVAPAIEAELVQAGFQVNSDPVTAPELGSAQLSNDNWDIALVPVAVSPYPGKMAQVYSTSPVAAGEGESRDVSHFESPEVDTLFEQAGSELDAAKAAALYQQIDTLLWQDMPSVPLFAEPTLVASSADVSRVQPDPWVTGPLWDAQSWARVGAAAHG